MGETGELLFISETSEWLDRMRPLGSQAIKVNREINMIDLARAKKVIFPDTDQKHWPAVQPQSIWSSAYVREIFQY